MKQFLLSCILLGAIQMESGQMEYKNNTLKLTGQVTVEHEMGTVTAAEAQLIQSKNGENKKEFVLEMTGEVLVILEKGGRLTCGKAQLESSQLFGTFFPTDSGKVVYKEEVPPLTIEADQMSVKLTRDEENKPVLSQLQTEGNTHLTYVDDKEINTHSLEGKGVCIVDHAKNQITFTADQKQVHFQNNLGKLSSDIMTLLYTSLEGKWKLKKIILEGHVSIFNHFRLSAEDQQKQYALADRVELDPDQHEVSLIATPPNRVLFMDPLNSVQMSAPALVLRRNPSTKKQLIEGKGDVRFTFVNQEFDKLKKRFQILPEEAINE